MGKRVTRAAEHVPAAVIQERMQTEPRAWRRRYWHIIWLALSAPQHAEEIAREAGVSPATVHRVLACYRGGGIAASESMRKGGRRHGCLQLGEEEAFLVPCVERVARGERVRVEEIQQALQARVGHGVHRVTVNRRARYPSDLSDQEWALVEPLLPTAKAVGRPRSTDLREVLNAVCYVNRTGCQWRALPKDFAPWPTVWSYFRTWRMDGTWQRIHTALRERVRVAAGREPAQRLPTAAAALGGGTHVCLALYLAASG
jgi:transposase